MPSPSCSRATRRRRPPNALIAELDRLKAEPISDHELQRTKNQFARDYILSRESNQQKAMHLAHAIVIHKDVKTADGEFEIFQSITTADVQRVAQTYFRPENRLVLTVMPSGRAGDEEMHECSMQECTNAEHDGVACIRASCILRSSGERVDAQVADWPAERPPRPLPPRDIKFPPYQIRTLPNGLKVVAVLHHEQPAVSMRMLVGDRQRVGPERTSSGSRGCSPRSSIRERRREVGEGTERRHRFHRRPMGPARPAISRFVNMVVMKDSFEPGMRMLSDMVERPAFAPEEIDRQRQQLLSLLRVSLEDPAYIANAVFDRLVFGFNPYGMPDTGTPETMAGITRNDLLAFHRQLLRAEQRHPRDCRRRHCRGSVRHGVGKVFGALAVGARCRASSSSSRRARRGA